MYLSGAIFSLSEKRVFAVAVNHDGFYRILRASVNVKMKAKYANQLQKVCKSHPDMAGVTHKGIIGGVPSKGLLTRTFLPFHELKCAWVRHPDGEQKFGAAGFRSALTSEKGGKVQLNIIYRRIMFKLMIQQHDIHQITQDHRVQLHTSANQSAP